MRKFSFFVAILFCLNVSSVCYAWIPSDLKWPLPGLPDESRITSAFGDHWENMYCNGYRQLHTALDLVLNFAPTGNQPVYAIWSGKVAAVKSVSGTYAYTSFVTISHGTTSNPWTATYHHINPIVYAGQTISYGQKIGTVVASNPGGAHLHIGVRDRAYSNTANRGRLPESIACGGDPAFPAYFVDPSNLNWRWY